MNKDSHHFSAYVDGSYRRGRSGYGIIALSQEVKGNVHTNRQFYIYGGFQANDSLHQMNAEFAAASTAIEFAINQGATAITVYYDCTAIEFWARKRSQVKAHEKISDLFLDYNRFIRAARKLIHIEFRKVPAHKNHALNNEADGLAKYGLKQTKSKVVRLYNPSLSAKYQTKVA